MKDGVIKNDGTSRRIYANLPATYEDFRMAAAQGDVLADVLFNADGWQQQPDFLSKRNLLQDVTAGLFGLGTDAVPDDVLQKLAGAAFDSGGTITDVNGNPLGVRIATGYYVGTGKYGSNNPNSLTFQAKPKKVSIVGAYINSASSPGYGQHYNEAAFYCDVISGEYTSAGYGYLNYGGYQNIGGSDYKSKLVGNTLSWYNTSRAEDQFNESGVKYYYFAIL